MGEPNVDKYKPMSIRFSPASIPQIVAHIQKWLVEHPYISLETVATLIEEALQEHPELINGSVIPITEEDTESIKDYIDALPVSDTYTKSEIDTKLEGKENTLTFDSQPTENSTNPVTSTGIYTYINNVIDIIDAALALKADKIDTYTKTATDNLLNDKADKSNVYTKNTIDAKLETKADINDVITYETAEQIMDDIAVRSEDGTAPKALSTGQYVIVDEVLYQLTADVQIGDTLTIGTNIQTVPDGGLNSLNSQKADQTDLSNISITGTTNTAGATIKAETYFFLNGILVKSKTDILSGETFTSGTNYIVATAGGLNPTIDIANIGNAINILKYDKLRIIASFNGTYEIPSTGYNLGESAVRPVSSPCRYFDGSTNQNGFLLVSGNTLLLLNSNLTGVSGKSIVGNVSYLVE